MFEKSYLQKWQYTELFSKILFITNSLYLLKLHASSPNSPNHILIKLNLAKDSPLKANKSLSVTSQQEKIPNEVFSSPRLKSQIGIYLPLKGVSYSNEIRIKNTFLFPTIPLSLIQYTAGRHLLIFAAH